MRASPMPTMSTMLLLHKKPSPPLKTFILVSAFLFLTYILVSLYVSHTSFFDHHHIWSTSRSLIHVCSSTSIDHVVFGIASNAKAWPKRKEYVNLWWKPEYKGCMFLDEEAPVDTYNTTGLSSLPPVCISQDTSQFRYTHRGGLPSAIRVARVVSETIALNHTNVRWFVFGDDDTVFFPENVVTTLSKYDHNQWYYIGTNSEVYEQNDWFSHEMAFGGGGFALSYPLAKVFAKIFDSCLVRYPHLYGSDARISSCLAELGVGLTHESGFHQIDLRGDIFGLLTGHPLQPLVSLHHLDYVKPIFPNMSTNQAAKHLFKAAKLDPARILQQSICYDKWYTWSILISWGYAVQVLDRHVLLPDLLPVQKTFRPWNEKGKVISNLYMFNTKKIHPDPCKRPTAFFLEDVMSSDNRGGIQSTYRRSVNESCLPKTGQLLRKLELVKVFSQKMDRHDARKAPRRQCCDVLPSSIGKRLHVAIRECGEDELVYMHT